MKTVTLITGASSGIGHGLAELAIKDGHHVILCARRSEPLEKLKALAPERVTVVAGDVTTSEVRGRLLNEVQILGHLDYLFNNAGFGWFGPLASETPQHIDQMISLNVSSLIHLTRDCLGVLGRSKRGRVINIASAVGHVEIPFMSVYVATKYAVVGFSRALNLELAQTSITATAVCPGATRSEFSQVAFGPEKAKATDRLLTPTGTVVCAIWKGKSKDRDIMYPTFPLGFL